MPIKLDSSNSSNKKNSFQILKRVFFVILAHQREEQEYIVYLSCNQ